MPEQFQGDLNAENLKVAIVVARFNRFICQSLLDGALDCLYRHNVKESDTHNIVNPYNHMGPIPMEEVLKKNLFQVDTIKAILDENYYVDLFKQAVAQFHPNIQPVLTSEKTG